MNIHILKHVISFYFQLKNRDSILRMQTVLKAMPLLLPSVVYTVELVETEETKLQKEQGYQTFWLRNESDFS